MTIKVKNWSKHQHFKDRTPPWIKLYRDILDDPDWHELDGDSAKALISLWLIASEDKAHTGALPDVRRLSFRLRISESKTNQVLTKLSHWLIQDDIETISERHQDDAPETETETEIETEKNIANAAKKPPRCPVDDVVELYHKVLPELPKMIVRGPDRDKLIKDVWEKFEPESIDEGMESFSNYFTLVRSSQFLMGKVPASNGHRVFKANLEWLVTRKNFAKVVEKNYHENR